VLEFGTLIYSKTQARYAEGNQAKSSAWEALRSVLGPVVGKCESVFFEIEARMDSFAPVLTTLSHSGMYKFFLLLI
jgi:hypothetical protein